MGETAQKHPNTGKVVAVSEGSQFEVSQILMYMKNAGTSFKEDPLEKEDNL